MRLIIPAAGFGLRWGYYWSQRKEAETRGWHKHLAEIDGEPIIHRLVRLFSEAGVDDIWVLSRFPELYTIPGSQHHVPPVTSENGDADKYVNSQPLWSEGERTALIYGDTFITPEAVATIVADDAPLRFYGRLGKSRHTGAPESVFGLGFQPEMQATLTQHTNFLIAWKRAGLLGRNGSWELAHSLSTGGQLPGDTGRIDPTSWIEIDDLTQDVDTPVEYEALRTAVEQ